MSATTNRPSAVIETLPFPAHSWSPLTPPSSTSITRYHLYHHHHEPLLLSKFQAKLAYSFEEEASAATSSAASSPVSKLLAQLFSSFSKFLLSSAVTDELEASLPFCAPAQRRELMMINQYNLVIVMINTGTSGAPDYIHRHLLWHCECTAAALDDADDDKTPINQKTSPPVIELHCISIIDDGLQRPPRTTALPALPASHLSARQIEQQMKKPTFGKR